MIYQNDTFENTENLFADAVKDLQISKLLHKSNVRKSCGVPASAGFSGKKPLPIPEFQTQGTCCLKKHLLSFFERLLARVYDHVDHKTNRYQEISEDIDHRTNGFRAREEALMKKTDAAVLLVRRALWAGIQADYVLMDTWFTTEPMIHALLTKGIHVIGMVKQLKQTYLYHGRYYTLPKLQKIMQHDGVSSIFGSVVVTIKKEGLPVKIVFVRNRNKSSECLYILSTDCSLSESEIVRTYGNRWSIELFFMLCDDIQDMDLTTVLKSLMALFVEYLNHYTAENTKQVKGQLINWIGSQPLFIQALFGNLSWES